MKAAMEQALSDLADNLRAIPGVAGVQAHATLAPYTTWRVGGPADLLCVADRLEGLVDAARAAQRLGAPWLILGRGSNVLVRDGGIAGLVIINRTNALHIEAQRVLVDGGMLLSTLARRTCAAGLAGLEWSAGIPGSVGGAVVSNAGAHGGEIVDTLRRVHMLDGNVQTYWEDAAALELAYRHSRLRASGAPTGIVLQAEFLLQVEDPAAIHARMAEQKRQRKMTQPTSQASAGSVFKNPPGDSAARLIDAAGLKGLCMGGAHVSMRHANFMVNTAAASAADLLALIDLVRERVYARFGVELTLEVQLLGREA